VGSRSSHDRSQGEFREDRSQGDQEIVHREIIFKGDQEIWRQEIIHKEIIHRQIRRSLQDDTPVGADTETVPIDVRRSFKGLAGPRA
jgi:hypothetical protein